jgi:hypothetical protein
MYGKAACPVPRGTGDQPGYGRDIVAPSRKQVVTEKTNFFLQSRKAPVYSKDQIETFPLSFPPVTISKNPSVFRWFKTTPNISDVYLIDSFL